MGRESIQCLLDSTEFIRYFHLESISLPCRYLSRSLFKISILNPEIVFLFSIRFSEDKGRFILSRPVLFYYKFDDQKSGKKKDKEKDGKEVKIFFDEALDAWSEFAE